MKEKENLKTYNLERIFTLGFSIALKTTFFIQVRVQPLPLYPLRFFLFKMK